MYLIAISMSCFEKCLCNSSALLKWNCLYFCYSDARKICLQYGRPGFDPWVGKIPWRREWQHTPVLLPGEFPGQRSLASYSPWGCKESDMTERLTHTHWVALVPFFLTTPCSLRDLLLQPGIESRPSAVRVWSSNHWTIREFLSCISLFSITPYQIYNL